MKSNPPGPACDGPAVRAGIGCSALWPPVCSAATQQACDLSKMAAAFPAPQQANAASTLRNVSAGNLPVHPSGDRHGALPTSLKQQYEDVYKTSTYYSFLCT